VGDAPALQRPPFPMSRYTYPPLIPIKRIIDWTAVALPTSLAIMSSADPISLNEVELQALIAKYTLEYLYRWTNEFDAKELAQLRTLLASAPPEHIVEVMMAGHRLLPN